MRERKAERGREKGEKTFPGRRENSRTWKFLEKVEILEFCAESADELLIFVREIRV